MLAEGVLAGTVAGTSTSMITDAAATAPRRMTVRVIVLVQLPGPPACAHRLPVSRAYIPAKRPAYHMHLRWRYLPRLCEGCSLGHSARSRPRGSNIIDHGSALPSQRRLYGATPVRCGTC